MANRSRNADLILGLRYWVKINPRNKFSELVNFSIGGLKCTDLRKPAWKCRLPRDFSNLKIQNFKRFIQNQVLALMI